MCLGELPLIFSLPVEQVLSSGSAFDPGGAQAISLAAPRGALLSPDHSPDYWSPLRSISISSRARNCLFGCQAGLPIIGAGGVWTKENADAMIAAGALAVQVDAALWQSCFYVFGSSTMTGIWRSAERCWESLIPSEMVKPPVPVKIIFLPCCFTSNYFLGCKQGDLFLFEHPQ